MTSLTRWEPFRDLVSLREAMDRLFDESFVRPGGPALAPGAGVGFPVDMYETEDDVVVETALPGVDPEEVDITVSGNTLTIRAEIAHEEKVDEDKYVYCELRRGAYARSMTLPVAVEADEAEAEYEKGILTLRLPKVEEAKPKRIEIQIK